MNFIQMIISFIVLMFIICGVIIFFLRRALITSTEGAVKRLNEEIEKANAKQAELNRKLKEADEELEKRKKEARELAEKMRSEGEEAAKTEREKMINKAREESEEIVTKANNAKERMRVELEKQFDIRAINRSIDILNRAFGQKMKGAFDEVLINDFIENLSNTDMSKISPDIKTAEIVTVNALQEGKKNQIVQIVKERLGRDIAIKATTDAEVAGGVIIKFGSMTLDGSVKNLIRETAVNMQENLEAKIPAV